MDDLCCDLTEFRVAGLGQLPQYREGFVGVAAVLPHDDPEGLVDGAARGQREAQVFGQLGALRQPDPDGDSTGGEVSEPTCLITVAAVETVSGCDHAGITIVRRHGGVSTPAATDEVPEAVDAIQYEAGEGPCLEAIRNTTAT